jgi:hypothetical protein
MTDAEIIEIELTDKDIDTLKVMSKEHQAISKLLDFYLSLKEKPEVLLQAALNISIKEIFTMVSNDDVTEVTESGIKESPRLKAYVFVSEKVAPLIKSIKEANIAASPKENMDEKYTPKRR